MSNQRRTAPAAGGSRGDAMNKPTEPIRGEAAWNAAKKAVAERNEAAYARGRRERAASDAAAAAWRRDADRTAGRKQPAR
jgi:hypothetical protein